jgi:hypothetical protein
MIRIRCSDIGGGFGNKVPVYPGYVCAIAGSIVAGRPGQVGREPLREPDVHGLRRATTSCARDVLEGRQGSPACAST